MRTRDKGWDEETGYILVLLSGPGGHGKSRGDPHALHQLDQGEGLCAVVCVLTTTG